MAWQPTRDAGAAPRQAKAGWCQLIRSSAAAEISSAADEGVGAGYQDRLGVPDASNPSAPV